ncbi:tail fiber assembly protein [Yersinia sp. 2545 StPb PI]|uniref:tail fiber assembly protein n=1 Tax=Yersinia sp. 2545 StPb PI TaxID=3117410 RepID=UPI003FA453DF
MTTAYFSPSLKSFIPTAWKEDGTYTEDSWPVDAVLATDEEVAMFWKQTPPNGEMLGVIDGRPEWVDLPPLTHDELVANANAKKSQLKAVADSEISWRQDSVDGGYAEDNEVAELAIWKKYRVLLMRTDTSKAPDITWPSVN